MCNIAYYLKCIILFHLSNLKNSYKIGQDYICYAKLKSKNLLKALNILIILSKHHSLVDLNDEKFERRVQEDKLKIPFKTPPNFPLASFFPLHSRREQ